MGFFFGTEEVDFFLKAHKLRMFETELDFKNQLLN